MTDRFARIPKRAVGCRELSASDWRVFTCIALHADESMRAWPSMATIAEMTGIRRGDVPRSLRRLEVLRFLQVVTRGSRGVNVYLILFDDQVSATLRTVRNGADSECPQECGQGVRTAAAKVSAPLRTKHTNEQPNEQTHAPRCARHRVRVSRDSASEFETFWQSYPSRRPHANPRKPAEQAFEAAVKRGIDPAVIIRGAENYAAYTRQHVPDPKYIAQAVTWLRQERWNDHRQPPEPPRPRVGMN